MSDGISNMEVDGFRNAMNGHVMTTILSHLADDVALQDEYGVLRTGRADFGQVWKNWFAGFPDWTVLARTTTIQGWGAALEVTVTGTNTGPFTTSSGRVLSATGRKISLDGAWALWFNTSGKVSGLRLYGNPSTLYEQLGATP